MIAGVGVVRTSEQLTNAAQHLQIALRAPSRLDHAVVQSPEIVHQQDDEYIDYHGRRWQARKWLLLNRDLEVLSMERDLDDGHVVTTRIVPTALDYAAQLQLQFLANLIYYQCDALAGEGVARLALN
jgi:hypothetical protein